jgi:hypothetical protein
VAFSDFVSRWWPLPTCLDLVRGPTEVVAAALLAQVRKFVGEEQLSSAWVRFETMDEVLRSVSQFTNVPTVFFVLPTQSDWTVLWNNCFLCDGYDSLCNCLTKDYGLTTIHWQSSDEDAFFQAGSLFTARELTQSGMRVRSVYCCTEDGRWDFEMFGEPLAEEDTAAYNARRKRDRLNERCLMALLARLGARPWEDSFYRKGQAFRIERTSFPNTISRKSFAEFSCRKGQAEPAASADPPRD